MDTVQILLIAVGLTAMLGMGIVVFSGPSTDKESQRRLQSLR